MVYLIFIFIFGAIVGSFLNVLIYRLPRGESIVVPASHCPDCGHRLNWIDLVPVLGYFILGGKCRYCKKAISFRYPLVELLNAGIYTGVTLVFPPALFLVDFSAYLIFCSLLLVVFFTDLEQQVIPDMVSYSGIFFGMAYGLIKGSFFSSLLGAFLGFALLYLAAKAGKLIFRKEAMGEGDLFLAAFLGAYLGWQGGLLSLFLAFIFAGITALALLASGKVKFGAYLPFGPMLAAAGIMVLFFGQQLLAWYLGLFI